MFVTNDLTTGPRGGNYTQVLLLFFLTFIDSVFGEDLTEEIGKNNTETPWVISKCTEEIEKWCENHRKYMYSYIPFDTLCRELFFVLLN